MSKFIFYTDFHLTNKRPVNRNDDFSNNQLAKLKEIYDTAVAQKADFVLFGGDFFNKHRIFSYDLIHEALKIICGSGLITYAVQGQHDLVGYNRESYASSTLAFLENYSRGAFETLWKPILLGDFNIHPCHWFDDFDLCLKTETERGLNSVLLAHKSITMKKHPFETILTKNIKSEFELILNGDIHSGHALHKIGKTQFYNPGSISRMSIKDKPRKPKIALIESGSEIRLTEIALQNVQADVFNFNILEELPEISEQPTAGGDKFFEEIMELEKSATDLGDLIHKFGKQKDVSVKILDYISSKLART